MLGSNIRCHGPSQLPAVTRLPCILASLAFLVCSWAGCTQQDPIVTYTVPTKIPAKLMPGKDRMLAAMLPKGKEIWFFKVTGPEEAIESLQGTFRDFVEDIEFQDGSPKLKELPDGWRRGGEKPFRYATLDVDTPDKQLGISVSSLPLRDDAWDQQVQDNVNRWRGQLGLSKSDQKWAGGEPIVVENADPNAVWVDLVGETGGASTMSPPFANRSPPSADSSVRPGTVPPGSSVTDQRMLAAMVPKGSDIWFFKVMGEKTAVAFVEKTLQEFVENIEFNQGVPDLETLPKTWTKGGERPFRYATVDVVTPAGKLDISISKLVRQPDKSWGQQVDMNVNRWRGQMGLPASSEKWAGGQSLTVKAADEGSVWVDLVAASKSAAADTGSSTELGKSASTVAGPNDQDADTRSDAKREPIAYDRPAGWRDGRKTSMRLAAFDVGPDGKTAEITVIAAGGDLRGNVARWLGQVRNGTVPEAVVDQALKDAQEVTVAGTKGKRFLLLGSEEDAAARNAIDATIIPLGSDGTSSLFVKMTGPAETVESQASAIQSFLKSLKLNL